MANSLDYNCKFPNPPKFKNCLNGKFSFEVPKYYGFDHPCTKWLLGCIVSNHALMRLLKVAHSYHHILKRFHQLPDLPGLVLKDRFNAERAAYNNQAILYLTPLSIAIYMKYEDALAQLVNLQDNNNKSIVDPIEVNFVQNFWRKGDTRYFTDLITTYPAVIAVRRNYFIAFKYLLLAGYRPNDGFTLIYRKPHRELVIVFKDLIDFVIDYLKTRPAFNVGKLMQVLLQSSKDGVNILDIFCFDILTGPSGRSNNQSNQPDSRPSLVSLFQRVTRSALDEENMSEENGMHIINILEKIQEAGYFTGMPNSPESSSRSQLDLRDIISQTKDNKVRLKDLQSMIDSDAKKILEYDYRCCISNLIVWLQNKSIRRKTEQTIHLLNLLAKILFDTGHIELLFATNIKSDADLVGKLNQFPVMKDFLEENTATIIRQHINLVYQQSEPMMMAFLSRYKMEPMRLLYSTDDLTHMGHFSSSKNKPLWFQSEKLDMEFRERYIKCKEKKIEHANQSNLVLTSSFETETFTLHIDVNDNCCEEKISNIAAEKKSESAKISDKSSVDSDPLLLVSSDFKSQLSERNLGRKLSHYSLNSQSHPVQQHRRQQSWMSCNRFSTITDRNSELSTDESQNTLQGSRAQSLFSEHAFQYNSSRNNKSPLNRENLATIEIDVIGNTSNKNISIDSKGKRSVAHVMLGDDESIEDETQTAEDCTEQNGDSKTPVSCWYQSQCDSIPPPLKERKSRIVKMK